MANDRLRIRREATPSPSGSGRHMTRAELAEAVNQYVWSTSRKRICLDADTVSRYERGQIRWPSAAYREGLRAILGVGADVDLGFHPTPRGRTVSASDSIRPSGQTTSAADKSSVSEPSSASSANSSHKVSMETRLAAIGMALTTFPASADRIPHADLLKKAKAAHDAYQGAQYVHLARALPGLIAAVADVGSSRSEQAARSHVYLVTAKLLSKIGDAQMAHLAADRALQAALLSEQVELVSACAYQVTCTLLREHGPAEAEQFSEAAFCRAGTSSPTQISTKGALALISAVASARRGDPAFAQNWLGQARRLADSLGTDANYAWTAFGPTNVRIHEVSVAVDLDKPDRAIELAAPVDTDLLPSGLKSRRGQLHIDSAWAYLQIDRDPEAVINLLEAERFAPQTVHHSASVRGLVAQMLERQSGTPGLRGLARRVGVAA
ncbi:helix-turn-helix domain-containing protein [Promicromonospora sp. NFX87]|uniref:helix-turn-helix domain-containing protein n=1 Tax=Promicromonospora sp. NFX87 TaxID=3402691 RepID=UPI003AFB4273